MIFTHTIKPKSLSLSLFLLTRNYFAKIHNKSVSMMVGVRRVRTESFARPLSSVSLSLSLFKSFFFLHCQFHDRAHDIPIARFQRRRCFSFAHVRLRRD